jgi:Fe-S cluster assembly iron-binding protein IscA
MKISNEAIEALKSHLPAEQLKNKFIRFYAAQGCCGPSVQIEIADEKPETDEMFIEDDVQFSVDYQVKDLLQNATLLFTGKGFRLDGIESDCC